MWRILFIFLIRVLADIFQIKILFCILLEWNLWILAALFPTHLMYTSQPSDDMRNKTDFALFLIKKKKQNLFYTIELFFKINKCVPRKTLFNDLIWEHCCPSLYLWVIIWGMIQISTGYVVLLLNSNSPSI